VGNDGGKRGNALPLKLTHYAQVGSVLIWFAESADNPSGNESGGSYCYRRRNANLGGRRHCGIQAAGLEGLNRSDGKTIWLSQCWRELASPKPSDSLHTHRGEAH